MGLRTCPQSSKGSICYTQCSGMPQKKKRKRNFACTSVHLHAQVQLLVKKKKDSEGKKGKVFILSGFGQGEKKSLYNLVYSQPPYLQVSNTGC